MRVSIITTVYKAEKDLPRLLDSMMAQNSPELEFFLIDNGSPDRCGEICKEYAKKDSRFHVFVLEENIGYIRARNLGIKQCSGDYIGFCDSDDYLEPGGYDHAVDVLKSREIDLYLTAYNTVKDEKIVKSCCPYKTGFYVGELIKKRILPQAFGKLPGKDSLTGFAWKQIFKKSILIDNNIKYMPELQPYEDQILNLETILVCNTVYVDDCAIYNYIVNPKSITAKLVINFNLEEEWKRLVLFYNCKKKHAYNEIHLEAISNQMIEFFYTMILSYCKTKCSFWDRYRDFYRIVDGKKMKDIVEYASVDLSFFNQLVYKAIKRNKVHWLIIIIRCIILLRKLLMKESD